MERLFLSFILIITIVITVGINSFALADQQIRRGSGADEITDSTGYFLTIEDERENRNLIKTLGVFKVGDGGIEFELGEPISTDEIKIITPKNSSPSDLK